MRTLRDTVIVMALVVAIAAAICLNYRRLRPQWDRGRIQCIARDFREEPGRTLAKLAGAVLDSL